MTAAAPTESRPSASGAAPERILHRLDWQVIRRLDGLLQGDYRTLFYGVGVDFADIREYQPEDDIRHIDWNVTARLDAPYVREYVEDRELTAWMLLDRSPSMGFGPEERPKGLVLTEVVMTFSRLLTRRGNRVGAILYNNVIERTVPPMGGRNQVLRMGHHLLQPPPMTRTATDLGGLLAAAFNTFKRRSLVFLISDFITDPGWERRLALLAQRHDVVAIRLWDRRENEIPSAGLLVLEDAETGEQIVVDTGDPGFRRRLAEAGRAREERLAGAMARAGVELFDISTEEDLVGALVRMAERRKRRFR